MELLVFWISLGFLVYVYAGYPLILMLWRSVASKRVAKGTGEPMVSLVIAAHNEAKTLDAKLKNCLELNYPPEKLQIIVSLDGPTDGTELVARKYENRGVRVVLDERHKGKAAAINLGVANATGDILIFADARQRVGLDSIRPLISNFQDASVGAASGELVLESSANADSTQDGESVGLYWRYEKCLRRWESDIHSVVGATGALHAIRRELFRALPEDTILDDVAIPMNAVLEGKRVVFEPRARVYDKLVANPEEEFGRKVRTLMGNFQLVTLMPALIDPRKNRIWFQFASHKLARLLAPYFFLALYVSNLFLTGPLYRGAVLLQTACYGLAAVGCQLSSRKNRTFRRTTIYATPGAEESK